MNRSIHGSTLLMAMVTMSVIIGLFGTLSFFLASSQQQIKREIKRSQVIQLGTGAINHAIAKIRQNPAYTQEDYSVPAANPIGDITIRIVNSGSDKLIIPNRTSSTCNQFEVKAASTGVIVPGSYKESFGNCSIPPSTSRKRIFMLRGKPF